MLFTRRLCFDSCKIPNVIFLNFFKNYLLPKHIYVEKDQCGLVLPRRNIARCRRYQYFKPLLSESWNSTRDHRSLSNGNGFNTLSAIQYERVAEKTLQNLTDVLENILEPENLDTYVLEPEALDTDVSYGNGILTVNVGKCGTYVINKHSPNRQIWLSSPISGPKRYDYVDGMWIYKHDGVALHELLSAELSNILQREVDFAISVVL